MEPILHQAICSGIRTSNSRGSQGNDRSVSCRSACACRPSSGTYMQFISSAIMYRTWWQPLAPATGVPEVTIRLLLAGKRPKLATYYGRFQRSSTWQYPMIASSFYRPLLGTKSTPKTPLQRLPAAHCATYSPLWQPTNTVHIRTPMADLHALLHAQLGANIVKFFFS